MVTEVGESDELTFEWACNGEMYLGKLELQTVLVSQKAFDNLTFKNAESVDKLICYPIASQIASSSVGITSSLFFLPDFFRSYFSKGKFL